MAKNNGKGNGNGKFPIHIGRVQVYQHKVKGQKPTLRLRWRDETHERVSQRAPDDLEAAKKLARAIDKAVSQGHLGQDPHKKARKLLKPLLSEYRTVLERSGGTKHVGTVVNGLGRVFRAIQARTVNAVTVEAVDALFDAQLATHEEYLRRKRTGEAPGPRGWSVGTVLHYRGYLKSLFKWAEDTDRIIKSPLRALKAREYAPERRRQANSPDEIRLVLDAAEKGKPYEIVSYHLGYFAGLRQNEILNLRWGDIDFRMGTIRLIATRQKGHRDTVTKLRKSILAYLQALREHREQELSRGLRDDELIVEGAPKCARTLANDRKATVRRAGLKYYALNGEVNDWHAMRHANCTNTAAVESDIETLRSLLRHASADTTTKYMHTDLKKQEAVLDEVDKIEASLVRMPGTPQEAAE